MRRVFADTSFYLAMLNPDDAAHERALEWAGRISPDTVVTELVLIEVGNSLSRGDNRRQYVSLAKTLRAERDRVEIVPASAELFERGRDLYARRLDKEWSMTDCCSFVVMADLDLTDALTADRHFEQAGFKALLK
jgi:uncharacterized protein